MIEEFYGLNKDPDRKFLSFIILLSSALKYIRIIKQKKIQKMILLPRSLIILTVLVGSLIEYM